jgi:hypothetical protein
MRLGPRVGALIQFPGLLFAGFQFLDSAPRSRAAHPAVNL